jgi:Protein of unknown function (DUF1236)
MTNRFMISVAAVALIAGTGLANAQGGMNREGGSGGSTMQQGAPSSERGNSAAPTNRDAVEPNGPKSGMKATQSEQKPGATKSQSAEDKNLPGQKSKSMSSENDNAKASKDLNAEGREGRDRNNMNAEQKGTDRTDSKSQTTTQTQTNQKGMNAETKTPTDSKSTTTTGNAATSATAAPPPEKRTQIVSAIKSETIQETTNVNFELNIGARVPTSVHFYPLPPRIVEIYPEWRGYEVILVHGRYVIVRPQTHEIVYIIEG